jgi:hypothetical protein
MCLSQPFATAAYATYGERNHKYMMETFEKVKARSDIAGRASLRQPYDEAVGGFPSRTFNISQQTASFPHTDQSNLAQGWCSITPLGNFDPCLGGHLVLWNFGLVVQFPPGATALIPSALITHSNTTIQPGETRYSIVQYASGRVFRWVKNGFVTDSAWHKQATAEDKAARGREQAMRWEEASRSFFTLEELLQVEKGDRLQQTP